MILTIFNVIPTDSMSTAPITAAAAAAGGESQSKGSEGLPFGPDDLTLCTLVTRSLTRIKEDLKSTNAPILEMAASSGALRAGFSDPKAINQLFSKSINKYAEIAVSAAESLEQIRQYLIERMLAKEMVARE